MLHRFATKRAAALLVSAAALLAPAVAQAKTETVTSGGVTATFSYFGSYPQLHGEHVTIKRGTKVLYSAAVRSSVCGTQCAPGSQAGKSIHVLDLEHNGTRDVVLDLFSGGAHCCWSVQVFYPSGGGYKKAEHNFLDATEGLVDLKHNGRHEFLTANAVFAYAYSAYADSGFPIQVLTFAHRRFHDVTRTYPGRVRADARGWLKVFHQMGPQYAETEGVLAAWAADEYLLGRRAQALSYLNAQASAGHVTTMQVNVPQGHKFVLKLDRDLKKLGY